MSEENVKRPDVDQELRHLKDFQRQTLNYVFQRLYLDAKPTRRFLVADEVGLGKTLVARGVITRAIDHLWDRVDRVDVVYLCSNSDIARQNVRRLTPHGIAGVSIASRITLLPLTTYDLKSRKVNVIALTPGTSLDLKGNLGIKRERALLLHILSSHWDLDFTAGCRLFAGNASLQRFKTQVREFSKTEKIDEDLRGKFLEALDTSCKAAKDRGEKTLRERVEKLVAEFRATPKPTGDTLLQRTVIIGELRQVLAKSCINALEPDLIILDEFQRFKELLDGQGAAAEMATQLFEYEDISTKARVLLLSATPYKMYTVPDEAEGEDHYADFVRTAGFLLSEEIGKAAQLGGLLKEYRRELFRLGQGDSSGLESARAGIESILRGIMVRTERLAVTPNRNGMLVEKPSSGIEVAPDDARSYTQMQRLARLVDHPDTMEYWKSSPWLLNFMDQYKLSRDIDALVDDGNQSREFVKAIEGAELSLLPWADVESFRRLDPAHGRLRWLIDHTLSSGLWKLLWLPPGLHYYELGEPFQEVASHSPTKALLFSAWRVVPRVVASILSHEAERRMYVSSEGEDKNLNDAPVRLGNLLQVSRKDGRVAGLTVLSVIYPSSWLARECDPMLIGAGIFKSKGRTPTIEELVEEVENRISPLLERLTNVGAARTTPDESWYWAAPILLDRIQDESGTEQWFARDLTTLWGFKTTKVPIIQEDSDEDNGSLAEDSDGDGDQSALSDLVDRARRTASGELMPG